MGLGGLWCPKRGHREPQPQEMAFMQEEEEKEVEVLAQYICRALAVGPSSLHTWPWHSCHQPRSSGGAQGSQVLALLVTPHPKRGHQRRAAAGRCCKSTSAAAAGPKQPPGSLQNPRVQAGLTTTIPEISQPWWLEEGPGSCRPQVTRGKTQMENGVQGCGGGTSIPWGMQGGQGSLRRASLSHWVLGAARDGWETQGESRGTSNLDRNAAILFPARALLSAAGFPVPLKGFQLGRSRATLPAPASAAPSADHITLRPPDTSHPQPNSWLHPQGNHQ